MCLMYRALIPYKKFSFYKNIISSSPVQFLLKRDIHPYRSIIPWKNIVDFSKDLVKSVIHQDIENGLLVLNKPYGVSFSRSGCDANKSEEKNPDPEKKLFTKETKKQSKEFTKNHYYTSGPVSDSLDLVECLPYLKKEFQCEKLYLSRVPGKYVSGVAILTTNEELVEKINKIHASPPTGKDTYLAVVVGVPRYDKGKIKLGFKLEENSKIGKKVVLLREWSNKAFKRGEIRIGTFHFQTICIGHGGLTSLVEINVDLRKYNAFRVFAADHLLSPVLGDNLFGSRVQSVLGVPQSVHHFSSAALQPQKLPEEIYRLLGLTSGEAGLIPIHVHLSEMLLPRLMNKKDVQLRAPLPPHFVWTCERLGLLQPDLALAAV